MKKTLILLLCLVLLTSASACGKLQVNKERLEELLEIMDLRTFLQTVDLPDNFSIGFDAADVKSVDSARIYKAVPLELDANEVAEKLLKRESVSTKVYAEGPYFETGDETFKEHLYVFDGGKSFGIDSGVVGGLSYSVVINGERIRNKHGTVIRVAPGPPDDIIAQRWKYDLKSDYASFADLSFMSYKDALAAVEELLYDTLGFPELEVAEAYSMDLETMLKHYELYKAAGGKKEITFSKDDECYVFFFRQVIDGIPVVNIHWKDATFGETIPVTSVEVFYTKDGVRDIYAIDLLDIVEGGENKPLISAAKALQVVIDDYSEIILENETIVESMELCYVGVPVKNGYELVPAWVFRIVETVKFTNQADGNVYSYDSYSYYVVNAITGDRIE